MMRKVRQSKAYRQDFRREMRGKNARVLEDELPGVIWSLTNGFPLAVSYQDHRLSGSMKIYRECHIRPDLLLLYRYEGDEWLVLEGLGSHAELLGM